MHSFSMPPLALPSHSVPLRHTLAMASADHAHTTGAEIKPPSTLSTMLRSALQMSAVGGAAGAVAVRLPFIPGTMLWGGVIGAAAGALLGAVSGVRKARRQQAELRALMLGSLQPAPHPGTLGPAIPTRDAVSKRRASSTSRKARPRANQQIIVRRGDTLGKLARLHKVTVADLHAANRQVIGPDPNRIMAGARLVVPNP